ncbi:MAG: DUF423 domain-containing protein [Planctomycetes bacterium]|nr:DUF423 domain-containing protein [Planctomycetota bacterium]
MNARRWIAIGALLCGTAVAAGAFGAHGLKERITPDALDLWRTAALYHVLHGLALCVFGLFRTRSGSRDCAAWCFLVGTLIFASTLYGLALGGPRWLGAVTPFGGAALIVGWIDFAIQGWRARD